MSLNLHALTRGAINFVNTDLTCVLFLSTGKSTRDENLAVVPLFKKGEIVKAQFQPFSTDKIENIDNIEKMAIVRKVYLFAKSDRKKRPWAMDRPMARVGDYIQSPDLQFYRINAVIEDFSNVGWVCVMATMVMTPMDIHYVEDDDDENSQNESSDQS